MSNLSLLEEIHDSDIQSERLLTCILDMGELLLTGGAEVLRVEDTLTRLCDAYGFHRVNVFTITSSIVLTAHRPDGRVFTQTRRILLRDTDLKQVEQVNALSRKLCSCPVSIDEFRNQLENLHRKQPVSPLLLCATYAMLSAVFALFFGGSGWDGCAACLSGVVMFWVQYLFQKLRMNSLLQCLLVSACTALSVAIMTSLGLGNDASKITIGNIMLLIPGVAFTTALRDVINGDTIAGILGIVEAIVKAAAVAIGFALVLVQMGG